MAKIKVLGESGILDKIGKRNIILICAVLFVGLAVYLNYMWFSGATAPSDDVIYGDQNMSDLQAGTNNENDENADAGVGNTAGTDAYFASAQLSRQQARDEALQVLQTVLASADALETTKEEALSSISTIAGEIEKESNVEALILAKGFAQCVAVINGDSASVIVKNDGALLPAQVAQITEIVYTQTGILPANLTIISK